MKGTTMNDIKRTDRRITRTKKAIRIALAELLCEKDINTITIKDISEKADINRKTFMKKSLQKSVIYWVSSRYSEI